MTRAECCSVGCAVPDLTQYTWIVVNSSGGKDSQTALRCVVQECLRQGVDTSRVVVSHQCLGRMEWKGTLELVYKQAEHYGLRCVVSKYRDKEGNEKTLLDYARRRGKWPSNQQRWCTSDFKRGPGKRVLTALGREAPGNIIQVFGFRSEESPARAKKEVLKRNALCSTKSREVWDWCPILDWKEDAVWRDIRESGVPYHPAYDLGMTRLSCALCIFAPKAALMIAGRANPELLDEYCEVEKEIGHTFQNGRAIAEIRDAIAAGESVDATELNNQWNM